LNFAAAVIEAAPDGIMLVSREGVVELANPRAEQLFGHSAGELAGRRLDALIEEAAFPIDIAHSALGERVIAIVRDMSPWQERETERLRKLQDVSDVALRSLDPDALLDAMLDPVSAALSVTMVAVSMRDTGEEQIRVRAARGLPDGVIGWPITLGEGVSGRIAARGPRVYHEPAKVVEAPWNEHVPAELMGVPLMLGEDTIGALVVGRTDPFSEADSALLERFAERIARAIAQGRASSLARQAESRLRDILDDVAGIVWEAEDLSRRRHTFVSSGADALLGHPASDWTETDGFWASLIDSADREETLSRAAEAIAEGRDHELEYRVRTADGRTLWLRDRVHVLGEDEGGATRLRGLIVDVTERRELEVNFLQAQKMQAVGQLAGGVAHDFNNMLTAILGYSGLLAQRVTDAAGREDLAEIERAAKRAQGLTEQLLSFSRRQIPRTELFDLGELVAGLEPMLRRLIDEDIELAVEPGGRTVLLEGDPGRLEQVLVNLVINARDAMAGGGGTLAVTVETEGPEALLRVRDSGIGMDEATKARVFEPFFTTKPPGKGTGLGLSTVYSIVDTAGGRITVESAPGEGTEFCVALPLSAPQLEPAPEPDRPTVLIVEDELALRKLVRRVLEADGKRVLDAADGHAALAVLEREGDAIDLLITDVVMPGMNGPELVERVAECWPGLRVIFSSGYTDSRLAGRGFDEDKVELLRKPYTVDELRRRVEQALAA